MRIPLCVLCRSLILWLRGWQVASPTLKSKIKNSKSMMTRRNLFGSITNISWLVLPVVTILAFVVVEALRALHAGRLPVYMTWVLFGFLALLWALVYGGRLI